MAASPSQRTLVWRPDEEGRLRAFITGGKGPPISVAWAPQPGSQSRFLRCKVPEALYAGARGPGKTDAMIMDYLSDCGPRREVEPGVFRGGHGKEWRGLIFRRTFPELSDIIEKAKVWIPRIFPNATYNEGKHRWHFATGEQLIFAFMRDVRDYPKYHGHAYPWIGWEELTTWPTDAAYVKMWSCVRSPNPNVARIARMRATTNPSGVGHNWVKARFGLPVPPGQHRGPIITHDGRGEPVIHRVAFHGALNENRVLLHADPTYIDRLRASARNPSQRKAWLEGSWDIVSGGMFDDLWDPSIHVVPPIPPKMIPAGWRLDRSYDDGLTKPFSVGWWAQSNGEPLVWEGRKLGEVKGDLIRVAEWYGWTGEENVGLKMASRDIAQGIVDREKEMEIRGRVRAGPADSAIWNADPRDPGNSIAREFEKRGVSWEPADKRSGSRVTGWKLMRDMFEGARPKAEGRREDPGLFVSSNCTQFLRTIPVLARDEGNPDDVDTEGEDHIADETRYRVRRPRVIETRTSSAIY